jgi:putative FmdB family regulatory protein
VPIYEFTCNRCDNKFEKLVRSMKGEQTIDCPKCGSSKTVRTLSVFAVGGEQKGASSQNSGTCGRCGGPGPCSLG